MQGSSVSHLGWGPQFWVCPRVSASLWMGPHGPPALGQGAFWSSGPFVLSQWLRGAACLSESPQHQDQKCFCIDLGASVSCQTFLNFTPNLVRFLPTGGALTHRRSFILFMQLSIGKNHMAPQTQQQSQNSTWVAVRVCKDCHTECNTLCSLKSTVISGDLGPCEPASPLEAEFCLLPGPPVPIPGPLAGLSLGRPWYPPCPYLPL